MNFQTRDARWSLIGLAGWFLAALVFFYAWVLRVSPSVMVEPLMRDFAVSGAILGNLSAVYFYAYAGLQMPVGVALDRWGPRRALALSTLVAGAGAFLFGTAPNIELAYLGRALIGAGAAFGFLGSMVLAAAWFPAHRFALFSGMALAIGLLGGVSGQAPLALLVEDYGWRDATMMLAAGAFVLSLLIWLVMRDRPPGQPNPAKWQGGTHILSALWQVMKRPQMIAIAVSASLIAAPVLALGGLWGVPYVMTAYDVGRPEAAFVMSSILFGWVVGGPFWGWLSDRIGRRKLPIILSALCGALTMAALFYIADLSLDMFRLLLFANGVGGAGMSVSFALTRENNPAVNTGAALGLVNMAVVGGGAVFQPIVGLLLDLQWDGTTVNGARVYSLESYEQALLILPALYGLGMLVAFTLRETRCQPLPATA